MNIAVFCEESQAVCKKLRSQGHNAFSFDLQECSGGHPEWHVKEDCVPYINGRCVFKTCDGISHEITGRGDVIIAHPPCTHLAVSGARHFEKKRNDGSQRDAIELFCKFLYADCDRVAVENPMNIISGGGYLGTYFPDLCEKYGLPVKYSQVIQPYEFGDPHKKTTWLWLKGLPPLIPTNIVKPTLVEYEGKNGKKIVFDEFMVRGVSGDRGKARSKTFPGIAEAFCKQWAGYPDFYEDWMG